jgi:hypothetical protein
MSIADVLAGSQRWAIDVGDCVDVLRALPEACVDALVTDPPCGISFMGKKWDHDKGGRDHWVAWMTERMREAFRVMKPGAHGLVWALPRTAHWTALALEDAGFEIRDKVFHSFGVGFPKSLDVGKAIDKLAGAEREIIGRQRRLNNVMSSRHTLGEFDGKTLDGRDAEKARAYQARGGYDVTAPATDDAKRWQGWGTALKPAIEEWILIRKPFRGSVARNVLERGTGALNIDGTRVSAFSRDQSRALQLCGLDALANNAAEQAAYSIGGIVPSRVDDHGDHIRHILSSWAECGSLSTRPFSSDATCDRCSMLAVGFRGCCQACHRSRDALLRLIEEVSRELSPLQPGVLDGKCRHRTEWSRIHSSLCTDHLANWDAFLGLQSYDQYVDRGGLSQGRWPSHFLISHAPGCARVGTKRVKAAPVWYDTERPPSLFTGAETSTVHHADADGFETVEDWRCVDGCPVKELDLQSGITRNGGQNATSDRASTSVAHGDYAHGAPTRFAGDEGGASRFFTTFPPFAYFAKASRADREGGCDYMPRKSGGELTGRKDGSAGLQSPRAGAGRGGGRSNIHPTAKNTDLMRWLVRLVTPPNGLVLDMFAGSGSTGVACSAEGARFIGIEADPEYVEIARARIVGDAPLFNVGGMR